MDYNDRKAYSTEVDVLSEVRSRLDSQGIKLNKKQLSFLYSVIVRYIENAATDDSINEIRLPHLGSLYKREKVGRGYSISSKSRFTNGLDFKKVIELQNDEY